SSARSHIRGHLPRRARRSHSSGQLDFPCLLKAGDLRADREAVRVHHCSLWRTPAAAVPRPTQGGVLLQRRSGCGLDSVD
ncbi:hypothetical protein PMAYCL1PPCAC_33124, partial [Pristionchus mayeri]